MRKSSIFILGAFTFAFAFYGNTKTEKVSETNEYVYVGGMSAGFTLKSGNAQVIGLCEVMTERGVCSPALEAGLRTGDAIVKIEEKKVDSVANLNEIIDNSKGKTVDVEAVRGKDVVHFSITPAKDVISNHYKIGVLVRDSVSGIGTVTYIDKNGRFGSLGHAIFGEQKQEMKISDGTVYACSIVGIRKGVRGKAGELRGMFLNEKVFGDAQVLCDCGIFGQIKEDFNRKNLIQTQANSKDTKPGLAYIYSTVSGDCPKKYEIEIVKVDKSNPENKNFVIKIIDKDLIEETGGIVQGMSGSPILQEGKLVGAVTHVFLNDPTRGYGIDIERMMNN